MTDVTKQTYEEVFAEAHKRAVAIGESVGIFGRAGWQDLCWTRPTRLSSMK